MIHVIATITTQPEQFTRVLEKLLSLRTKVLLEQGCIQYQPCQDHQPLINRQVGFRPNTITLVEQWESMEDLNRHLETPHLKQYQADVTSWIEHVELNVLEEI